jgi:hypothetical protein
MRWRTGQKQDAEDRSNRTKSSTHHRFEVPPRIFPWLRGWKVFTPFKLFNRRVESPLNIVVLLETPLTVSLVDMKRCLIKKGFQFH